MAAGRYECYVVAVVEPGEGCGIPNVVYCQYGGNRN